MTKYAHINEIKDGVVFSDPWYKGDVWCQYRKSFMDTNWFMQLDTNDGEYNSLYFKMVLGRPTMVNSVNAKETEEGYSFHYPEHYVMSDKELGIDTACIYMGSMKNFEGFGESIAFKTGGDGGFGDLFVYTVKGEENPAGFVLFGAFDKAFMTEEELLSQLVATFEGKEISKEEFLEGTSQTKLANRMLLANELRIAQSVTNKEEQTLSAQDKGLDTPER